MTSILDQFNSTLRQEDKQPKIVNNVPRASGYVTFRTEAETPIFTKQAIKINFPHELVHVRVCNNWLVALMANNALVRINLLQPAQQDEIPLDKFMAGQRASNLFLDPLGNHLLITLTPKSPGFTNELLYLYREANIPKKCDKFRDYDITAIGFNYSNTSKTTTGSILFGTSKGLLFETEFSSEGDRRMQNNWKQVFDIGKGEHCPITGIEFHKVPGTMRYIIMVTTNDRLYKFHENLKVEEKSPFLQNVFNSYLNVPEDIGDFYKRVNGLKYSKLKFSYDTKTKYPKYLGWLTEQGIFIGEIDKTAENPQFILNEENIPFPGASDGSLPKLDVGSVQELNKARAMYPISFVLTQFHALLLYPNRVTAVSLLNYKQVYDDPDRMLDIVKDTLTDNVYTYSNNRVFRYKIKSEHRDVWRMYLDKNEFDLALEYSRDYPPHLDAVLVKQAEFLFQQRQYASSASIYAKSQSSFEAVCLKFLQINEKTALMTYLSTRLETLSSQDKTQITMLVVWMVELYLTEIAQYSDDKQKCNQLQKEFDGFIKSKRVADCIRTNRSVIYDLMASHGDNFNLTTLTTANKDFESVVNQYINQSNYTHALSILQSHNKPDLFYKYGPILMEHIPRETTSALIAQDKQLDPIRLLPTLISLDSSVHTAEVIRYLEFCIHKNGCTVEAIHNFLLKMYAQNKTDKLLTYLETQGNDISLIHYDVHYALRVCGEQQAKEASVFLQCLLELWHPAVELALTFDTKLAQRTASQPSEIDLRRKLWLRIAEHEIRGKDDVKQALELLKDCNLLRIEDLLPFFSDFEKIDHFKDAICDALKEYNIKIEEQRREMNESAISADKVRKDLQTFRNRSIAIGAQEQCAICSLYLLLKPFFIFPCGHKFHGDCLEKQLKTYLSAEQYRKLMHLKQQLEVSSSSQQQADTGSVNGANLSTRDQLKAEFENMVAADCLFCGEYMIDSIDKPFVKDWDRVNSDWL